MGHAGTRLELATQAIAERSETGPRAADQAQNDSGVFGGVDAAVLGMGHSDAQAEADAEQVKRIFHPISRFFVGALMRARRSRGLGTIGGETPDVQICYMTQKEKGTKKSQGSYPRPL